MPEVLEQHTGWETFTADTDTLQHTITSQLMQNKLTVNLTWAFVLVGDDTTDEVRGGGHECTEQVLQLLLVTVRDSLECGTLSAATGDFRVMN